MKPYESVGMIGFSRSPGLAEQQISRTLATPAGRWYRMYGMPAATVTVKKPLLSTNQKCPRRENVPKSTDSFRTIDILSTEVETRVI